MACCHSKAVVVGVPERLGAVRFGQLQTSIPGDVNLAGLQE
jgi:hypothetical protein